LDRYDKAQAIAPILSRNLPTTTWRNINSRGPASV